MTTREGLHTPIAVTAGVRLAAAAVVLDERRCTLPVERVAGFPDGHSR